MYVVKIGECYLTAVTGSAIMPRCLSDHQRSARRFTQEEMTFLGDTVVLTLLFGPSARFVRLTPRRTANTPADLTPIDPRD